MLGDKMVMADVAVKDLATAKAFYEGTLGLKSIKEDEYQVVYQCGGGKLHVYQSQFAGTNQATCASWSVGDVGSMVEQLKSKGVSFEHYDMPGVTREGDVHVMGDMRAAWFKDPDGNILCLSNQDSIVS